MNHDPQSERLFDSRYALTEELRTGPYSRVYKATQVEMGRPVVIKYLTAPKEAKKAWIRFRREARLLARLHHRNTLTLYDFRWQGTKRPFMVMELVPGVTLGEILGRDGALGPLRAVRIIRQVLGSLREAHSKSIIHRDLKPHNIMIFDTAIKKDMVKVLDFGVAKLIDPNASQFPADDITLPGQLVGTPRYMAPELLAGQTASPASDLFAVGLMFYELITGKRAITGNSTDEIIAQLFDPAPIVAFDDPDVHPLLREVVRMATCKDPDMRMDQCEEFFSYLDCIDPKALAAPQ